MSPPITVRRDASFIDPLSIEDLDPPTTPTIQASWRLRMKRIGVGAVLGGTAGLILGGLAGIYFR